MRFIAAVTAGLVIVASALTVRAGEDFHRVESIQGNGQLVLTLLPGRFNLVDLGVGGKVRLSNAGLREAGFSGCPEGDQVNPGNSDELRIPAADGDGSPVARILMNADGSFVYWTGGARNSSAEDYLLDLSRPFVVRTTRSQNPLDWTVDLKH